MRQSVITPLLLVAIICAPIAAWAEGTHPFRCVSVPEMAGESMKVLLSKHIEQSLKDRKWQKVSVNIDALRQSKSTTRSHQLLETTDVTRGVAVVLAQQGNRAAKIRGRLGPERPFSLSCSVSLKKSSIFVSGEYQVDDGRIVRVRRVPIDVSELLIPGVLVPEQGSP